MFPRVPIFFFEREDKRIMLSHNLHNTIIMTLLYTPIGNCLGHERSLAMHHPKKVLNNLMIATWCSNSWISFSEFHDFGAHSFTEEAENVATSACKH